MYLHFDLYAQIIGNVAFMHSIRCSNACGQLFGAAEINEKYYVKCYLIKLANREYFRYVPNQF